MTRRGRRGFLIIGGVALAWLSLVVAAKWTFGFDLLAITRAAHEVVAVRPADAPFGSPSEAPDLGPAAYTVTLDERTARRVVNTLASVRVQMVDWYTTIMPVGMPRCGFHTDVAMLFVDAAGKTTAELRLCFRCSLWQWIVDGVVSRGEMNGSDERLRALLAPHMPDAASFGHPLP
jgi:hypothetical protein